MKLLILACVCVVLTATCATAQIVTLNSSWQPRGTLTKVDKLSAEESGRLRSAKDKLAQAQKELETTELAIKRAHGDAQCPDGRYLVNCIAGRDVVLIDDFALMYEWQDDPNSHIIW